MPCSLELRADTVGLRLLPIRARLQHVDARAFDVRRRAVALARDFAVLLGDDDFEVRQHVVEVVALRAFLGIGRGAGFVGARLGLGSVGGGVGRDVFSR